MTSLLDVLGLTSKINPLEEFKCYTKYVKKSVYIRALEEIISRLHGCRFRMTEAQCTTEEDLALRILVRKYTGVLYRCLEDDLDDGEVMSNEEECAWQTNERAFEVEAILSRIITEPIDKAIDDVRQLQKIAQGSSLDKFIYIKETQ